MQVFRINLKTHACGKENKYEKLKFWEQREWRGKLIDFCLQPKEQHPKEQYVAIGWSCAYKGCEDMIHAYADYYKAAQKWKIDEKKKKDNASWKIFDETEEDDLFWTRDLDGNYWICRAKGKAEAKYDKALDIGAVVPVEAYKVGLEVPGQICGSFNRVHGGTAQRLNNNKAKAKAKDKSKGENKDKLIEEYSKFMFNQCSHTEKYTINPVIGNLLETLPAEELEELVIDYLQITKNYYVLSNSIANHSTTIKIECEFRSRDVNQPDEKAVVQVKSLGRDGKLDAKDYESYAKDGYKVYLFGSEAKVIHVDEVENCERITEKELMDFYKKCKSESESILPDSITKWEKIIEDVKQASKQ